MRLLFAAMIALAPTAATAQQGIFTPFRPQIVGQGHPSSPSYGGYAYRSYRPYFRGGYVAPRDHGGAFGGKHDYPGGMMTFARDLDQAQWLTGTGPYKLKWELHQPPLEQSQFAMGLGWHIARDGQTRWHNGQTGGYHAVMYVNRPLEVGVVLLTNTATGEVDQLAEKIVQMLAGMPVEPPTFEKPMDVHPDILERYVGKFQLVAGADFTVTTKDSKLFVGLTGQPTFEVYPRSETQWYYKVVKATLTFEVDDKGKCNAVELFQNGVRQKAKRIE